MLHGVVVTKVQDPAFSHVEPNGVSQYLRSELNSCEACHEVLLRFLDVLGHSLWYALKIIGLGVELKVCKFELGAENIFDLIICG